MFLQNQYSLKGNKTIITNEANQAASIFTAPEVSHGNTVNILKFLTP